MERKLKLKIENNMLMNKENIKKYIEENKLNITDENGEDKSVEFLQYIYDMETVDITEEDFMKRKRTKNQIDPKHRCCAFKSNNQRCSRKKKGDSNFCGTHDKGKPNGFIDDEDLKNITEVSDGMTYKKVSLLNVSGLHQYVDDENNIYSTNDIIENKDNPKIIGKCTKIEEGFMIHEY